MCYQCEHHCITTQQRRNDISIKMCGKTVIFITYVQNEVSGKEPQFNDWGVGL